MDQIYSPTPMPGFVSEAASFCRPAVICGYNFNEITKLLPKEKIPPSHYCHPDDLENAIEKLILDKAYRLMLGKRAYEFIKTIWSAPKVAERYIKLIEGTYTRDWLYDPNDNRYVHGCGISEKRAKEVVKLIIEKRGKEALCLDDKPELVKKFVEFASSWQPGP